jgi:hypothetical protein
MIRYYLRPQSVYVKIDTEKINVTNVINSSDQKLIGEFSGQDYVNQIIADSSKWATSDESSFNTQKDEVLSYLNN